MYCANISGYLASCSRPYSLQRHAPSMNVHRHANERLEIQTYQIATLKSNLESRDLRLENKYHEVEAGLERGFRLRMREREADIRDEKDAETAALENENEVLRSDLDSCERRSLRSRKHRERLEGENERLTQDKKYLEAKVKQLRGESDPGKQRSEQPTLQYHQSVPRDQQITEKAKATRLMTDFATGKKRPRWTCY